MLGKFGLVGVAEPPTSATGWFGHPHTNRRRVAETNPKANGGGRSYKGARPPQTSHGNGSTTPSIFFKKFFLKKNAFIFFNIFLFFNF